MFVSAIIIVCCIDTDGLQITCKITVQQCWVTITFTHCIHSCIIRCAVILLSCWSFYRLRSDMMWRRTKSQFTVYLLVSTKYTFRVFTWQLRSCVEKTKRKITHKLVECRYNNNNIEKRCYKISWAFPLHKLYFTEAPICLIIFYFRNVQRCIMIIYSYIGRVVNLSVMKNIID